MPVIRKSMSFAFLLTFTVNQVLAQAVLGQVEPVYEQASSGVKLTFTE